MDPMDGRTNVSTDAGTDAGTDDGTDADDGPASQLGRVLPLPPAPDGPPKQI